MENYQIVTPPISSEPIPVPPPAPTPPKKTNPLLFILIPLLFLILLTSGYFLYHIFQPKKVAQINEIVPPSTTKPSLTGISSSNWNHCFNYTNEPTPEMPLGMYVEPKISEVTKRCPIFFLKGFKDKPISNIFETDDGSIAIFQAGLVYTLSKDKPDFDKQDEELAKANPDTTLPKTILTDTDISVFLNSKPYKAKLTRTEYCPKGKECTVMAGQEGILIYLEDHNGYWYEIIGLGEIVKFDQPEEAIVELEQL